MATEDEFNLTVNENSLRELRETVDYVMGRADSALRRRHIQYPSGGGGGGNVAIGRAASAITPADSNLTGSAFTFVKFVPDKDIDPQTTPKTLKEELDDEEEPKATPAVNRSTKLSANVNAFVQLHKVHGEWTLLTADDECHDEEDA